MKSLWVDGQCFQTGSAQRGIGRYVLGLLQAMVAAKPEITIYLGLNAGMPNSSAEARSLINDALPQAQIVMWQGLATAGEADTGFNQARQASELALAHHVSCLGVDAVLCPSPFEGDRDRAVVPAPRTLSGIPCFAIVYDFIPWRFKQQYLNHPSMAEQYQRKFDLLADYDYLLAISEFTQNELNELLPKRKTNDNCCSIGSALSEEFITAALKQSTKSVDWDSRSLLTSKTPNKKVTPIKPYILYVGALDWRKNVGAIIRAYSQLPSAVQAQYDFRYAGPNSGHALMLELRQLWAQLKLPADAFKDSGYVDDAALIDWYRGAAVSVQASLMEGFGLTVLESQIAGCPTLGSKVSAIPEALGNRDAEFDPENTEQLAQLITKTLTDQQFKQELVAKAKAHAAAHRWSRCAETAWSAMEQAYGRSNKTASTDLAQIRANTLAALRQTKITEVADLDRALAACETTPRAERWLLDASCVFQLPKLNTGIQRVVKGYIRSFLSLPDINAVPIACTSPEGFFSFDFDNFKKSAMVDGYGPGDHLLVLDSNWGLEHFHLPLLLQAKGNGAKIYLTIYDLIPLTHPGFCDAGIVQVYRNWLIHMAPLADAFLCISEATADVLHQLLDDVGFGGQAAIHVFPMGSDFTAPRTEQAVQKTTTERSYLMVGTLEPRKGHAVALAAFEQLWAQGLTPKLVIAGRAGWAMNSFIQRIKHHSAYGKLLQWVDTPSDAALQALYAQSDALIAASYAEGFGLPIIEAAQNGKRVIASDLAVFREAAAGSVEFFKTGDATDLAKVLKADLQQHKEFEVFPKNILKWQDCAPVLLDILKHQPAYKIYRPKQARLFSARTASMMRPMREKLLLSEQTMSLRAVGEVDFENEPDRYRLTFFAKNTGRKPLSSDGIGNDQLGVRLGVTIKNQNGEALLSDPIRIKIPLVMMPAAEVLFTAEIPLAKLAVIEDEAYFMCVNVVQEAVTWWSQPSLQVPFIHTLVVA